MRQHVSGSFFYSGWAANAAQRADAEHQRAARLIAHITANAAQRADAEYQRAARLIAYSGELLSLFDVFAIRRYNLIQIFLTLN